MNVDLARCRRGFSRHSTGKKERSVRKLCFCAIPAKSTLVAVETVAGRLPFCDGSLRYKTLKDTNAIVLIKG